MDPMIASPQAPPVHLAPALGDDRSRTARGLPLTYDVPPADRSAAEPPVVLGFPGLADLPLPAEDVRGSLRMLVLTGLAGVGFWIAVALVLT